MMLAERLRGIKRKVASRISELLSSVLSSPHRTKHHRTAQPVKGGKAIANIGQIPLRSLRGSHGLGPVSLRKLENARSPDPRTKSQRQIASPNSSSINCSCASGSPLLTHLARPFRIMWTASIPCNVRHAVEKDWYPLASQTRFFETRWSCSTTLFKYLRAP